MPGPRNKGMRKPKDLKKTLQKLFSYLKPYKLLLAILVVLIFINSAASIMGTYFLKPLINEYIVPFIGHKNPDLSAFSNAVIMMAALYIAGAAANYAGNRIMLHVSTSTLRRLREDLFEKLQTLPIKYFDTHTHGEIMSRFTNDIDAIRDLLSQVIMQLCVSILTVIGVFCTMLILSPALTVLVVLILILILNLISVLGKKSGTYFMKQQKAIGQVNGYIEEMIEGQKVVKIFNHEQKAKENFDKVNEQLFETAKGAHTFASILMPIMGNISYMHYALTAMVGAVMSILWGFDLGSLAAFLQYTRSFSQPITQMSQQFNSILNALAGAERIFEIMDETPEEDNGKVTLVKVTNNGKEYIESENGVFAWKTTDENGNISYIEVKGNVSFDNVKFGYTSEKTVLKGISLYAKPGQKIAFVGSTGAGKTTITNLINRFYDINEGNILYDGIKINEIKKSDLRRSQAFVLQDTHLFTGTVADNIRYGKLDATDEEIIYAAKLANADSFIRRLPKGYETKITADGANLSQGQRQLLAIARAAIANPPVLVLDEATSSIDTRTEALIEKGMDTLMKGRTVFVIAHRLSTVRNSNAIMVLENGEIIERGDHEELLKQKGKYYQLYMGMFELS